MEIEIVLLLVFCSLVIAYLLHTFQKKREHVRRHIGDMFFTSILVISLVIIFISILVGGWNGLFLAAIGVYLLIPSLSGLILTKVLKKYNLF